MEVVKALVCFLFLGATAVCFFLADENKQDHRKSGFYNALGVMCFVATFLFVGFLIGGGN